MPDDRPPVLALDAVRRRYGAVEALRGVSLAVRPGELFGLLGPNGAGKTTLLSLIAGLSDPSEGSIELFGTPFTSRDRTLRRKVGLATQDLAVYPELTARENLRFFGQLYGMRGEALADRVGEMLRFVALTDRADARVAGFSGGMKRRLNLAAAVMHRPELVLLDEPTTGVDPQSRNHIFEQVLGLNAAGLTVIYTSHYMEEVQTLCPRLAILDHGQVQACDTLDNLLARLDSVVRVTAPAVPPALVAELAALPGVTGAERTPEGLAVRARDLAPLLPRLAALSERHGLAGARWALETPTLERVFLDLTGATLRD